MAMLTRPERDLLLLGSHYQPLLGAELGNPIPSKRAEAAFLVGG
jgi:hypothetical protein